jgi:hypothetical protein
MNGGEFRVVCMRRIEPCNIETENNLKVYAVTAHSLLSKISHGV